MPRHKHHGGGHQKRHQKSAKHPKVVSASVESVPTPTPSSSMTKTQKRGRKRQRQQQQHDKQQPQHAPPPTATPKHKRQKHKHSQQPPQRSQKRQRHNVGGGAGGGAGAGVGGKVAASASPSAAQPQPKAQRRRLKGEALWSIRTPLPPLYKYSGSKPFLSPGDDEYDAAKEMSYGGFHVDGAAAMPQQVHKVVHAALEEMRRKGLFHYDVVAAGGSGRKAAVSSTFVQRVLVGRRGMTYHYQKLRIFALPWDDKYTKPSDPVRKLRLLNDTLRERAQVLAAKDAETRGVPLGSCDYSVSLINYMPARADRGDLRMRDEPRYHLGEVAVSWHADSSLQPHSTIGVYQVSEDEPGGQDWRVAVRVGASGAAVVQKSKSKGKGDRGKQRGKPAATNSETVPLCVTLKSYQSYYMLNDFNHHHHHCVMTGDAARYSSTHRVAVQVKDTWKYIAKRTAEALGLVQQALRLDAAALRAVGETAGEVEFQWLRMFWLQGTAHAKAHAGYWSGHIQQLTGWWEQLEACLGSAADALCQPKRPPGVTLRAYDMMLYLIQDRVDKRGEYNQRIRSPAYQRLPHGFQPVLNMPAFPPPGRAHQLGKRGPRAAAVGLAARLPEDVTPVITAVQKARLLAANAGVA